MWLKRLRSLLPSSLRGREVPQRPSARPRRRSLGLERLESRVLLAVTPVLTTAGVTFTGGAADDLYLVAVGGVLEYSTDGTTFSSNLAPGSSSPQTLTLANDTTVTAHVGGTL